MRIDKPDILDDYREWHADQPVRVSTHSERCHLYHRDCMIVRLAAEVARLRQVLSQENATPVCKDRGTAS